MKRILLYAFLLSQSALSARGDDPRDLPIQLNGPDESPKDRIEFRLPDSATVTKRSEAEVERTKVAFEKSELLDLAAYYIAKEYLPETYDDDRKWGKTAKVFSGIDFDFEDGKLRTDKKEKEVKHGDWSRYSVELDESGGDIDVEIQKFAFDENAKYTIAIEFYAPIKVHSRYSKWARGVQLVSLSADANAKVKFQLELEIQLGCLLTKIPPDLTAKIYANRAEIQLVDFKVYKVSKLGGEFAEQVSEGAEKIIRTKLAEKEEKILQKINRSLTKHQDDFRLSIADEAAEFWSDFQASGEKLKQ